MASSSSPASSSPANSGHGGDDDMHPDHNAVSSSVPVETLVEHLLAAKRSLSSMTLVLRANDLSTEARQLYEDSTILAAQTAFLRRGIANQGTMLRRIRDNMNVTYTAGKREFNHLLKTLDVADGKLRRTMEMLQSTTVDPVFRPEGEGPKSLLDFVDEKQVKGLRDALVASVDELQAIQTSFDGDLFRFEKDLRDLKKTLAGSSSPSPPRSPADSANQYNPQQAGIHDLLASMIDQSHSMAEHLASLTHHFDMCVTAVRITEGGAALARRKAAEDFGEADPVSISGVIAEQDINVEEHDPQDKADIVKLVIEDASEVGEVVADLNEEMQRIEMDFNFLKDQADQVKSANVAVTQAFQILDDIRSRLSGYLAAETEFIQRWEDEKYIISGRLEDMENLRDFYDGYASAYDSLILEVERRRAIEEKIRGIWRKAKEQVDRLVESDWKDRETFKVEVGEYIPTDLWVGMSGPLRRWEVVCANEGQSSTSPSGKAATEMPRQEEGSAVTLGRNVVDAARDRIGMSSSGGT